MPQELRTRPPAQLIYNRDLSTAWRNRVQLPQPSNWELRDPEIESKMMRDDVIVQSMEIRRHRIAGSDWMLIPRDEASENAELSVAVGTRLIEGINRFSGARLNLARAFFSGQRWARIRDEPKQLRLGDGKLRTWRIPIELTDMDRHIFRIVPEQVNAEGGIRLKAHLEEWDIANNRYATLSRTARMNLIDHKYQDDQESLGYGRGLREALGWIWYAKTHTQQELLQAIEKHAQGQFVYKMDGLRDAQAAKPNSTIASDAIAVLEDMRARHILAIDSADSLEGTPSNGEGWQLIDSTLDRFDSKIRTLIIGANLTTSADKGGSFALAETQENSTETIVQFDRQNLEETFTIDLMGWAWWANHRNLVELGIAEDKPRFSITQEKREDPEKAIVVATGLHNLGLDLVKDELYEKFGMKKPEAADDVLEGTLAPPPGLGGFGDAGFQAQPWHHQAMMNFFEEGKISRDDDGKFAPDGAGGGSEKKESKGKGKKKDKKVDKQEENAKRLATSAKRDAAVAAMESRLAALDERLAAIDEKLAAIGDK